MKSFLICAVLIFVFHTTWAQKKICEPLDDGPYLSTLPPLDMYVREVTTEGLANRPLIQKEWYRSELRVFGNYEAGDFIIETTNIFLNPMDYFKIVSEDGKNFMELKTGIDRDGPTSRKDDDASFIKFILKCKPKDNLQLPMVIYDAHIFVDDINDNIPVISNFNERKDLDLSEAMPLDVVLTTVEATDLDLNLDKNLSFALTSHTDKFKIDANTGDLTLRIPLDFDAMGQVKYYDVVVEVEDGGPGTPRRATAVVRVHVHDADDQGPVFVYEMCWLHMGRCSWPKYTTGLKLTQDTPIVLQPVPNKGQGPVQIRARDLDPANSKINFKIASTIPPGSEDKFRLETTKTMDGAYQTKIIPKESMTVKEGFEIFLKAEEDTPEKRFAITMVFFTGGSGSSGSNDKSKNGDNGAFHQQQVTDDDEYSNREMALIVVTAVLAVIVLCLFLALIYSCRFRGAAHSKNLSTDGHPNTADAHDTEQQSPNYSNPAYNSHL